MKTFINLVISLLLVSANAARHGPAPVSLGTAAKFTILSKSGVSTVPNSVITGNVGVSPIAATALTGFSLTKDVLANTAKSTQVSGALLAADFPGTTAGTLTLAVLDMQNAYTDAQGRPNPVATEVGAGSIGGHVFTPGVYKWSSTVNIATDIILTGGAQDTWIFQIAGTFSTIANVNIILVGGAQAKHIVWAVAGAVSIGATGNFQGNILAATSVTVITGARVNGRILAQTAVALQMAIVSRPV